MQLGIDIKLKKWNPRILFRSIKNSFSAWLGTDYKNFTLNDDVFSAVRTRKIVIGAPGVADCDYNFASAENQLEQSINLGIRVSMLETLLDVKMWTREAPAGAVSFATKLGTASGGTEIIASGASYSSNTVRQAIIGDLAPDYAGSHFYISATPGANWDQLTQGKIEIHYTIIEPLILQS